MPTYHVDAELGNDLNNGLSPARPWKALAEQALQPGDSVLFKRGSVFRGPLRTRCGEEGAPMTYGAYGEGAKPAFLGSVAAGNPADWTEEKPSLWRYAGAFSSEVCHLIFDGGKSWGNLRWSLAELRHQGEWFYTQFGENTLRERGKVVSGPPGILYIYSKGNPATVYTGIECALWGQRRLASGRHHVVLENLAFMNAGVHGFAETDGHHITLRGCDFRFIGGAVWSLERRIRFGNAVEFWDGANDITVERCLFDKIYDSGVTHQGGRTVHIPHHLYFRDNLFIDCGMAAYECREPSREVYFEHNTCVNAGGGFSMQGEAPPRPSEIHPQPMGHHVFIWRIEAGTQPGAVYLRHNIFHEAPYGAALYSIIPPEEERKFIVDGNLYWQSSGTLLNRFAGEDFPREAFGRYQKASGQDGQSRFEKPAFRDEAGGDYRLVDRPGDPVGSRYLAV
ncbi:MAG: right-handed parallel beta-helix repeat-containing protein [Spirochaetes bacterium]|nr:right-handed parallel beta-helix repeat-containing protein [Spirochaetota bacterium]